MKKTTSVPHLAEVSDATHHRLHAYALAAAATGVSILALAPPAEAEIIYKKADVFASFQLDVNGDGIFDFQVRNWGSTIYGFLWAFASGSQNGVVAGSGGVAALSAGAVIGPAQKFIHSSVMAWGFLYSGSGSHFRREKRCFGPWDNVHARYLGLKFIIDGEVHYGWARLNEKCHFDWQVAKLTGYAYETIADQPIVAGQKKGNLEDQSLNSQPALPADGVSKQATLGMLAKGSSALKGWR
ncbi:MAG TPA: hypothetical protein VMI10_06335 [Terriglobales bacterium]|nr:hypothetical protein [Terriglobales bacterium]